MRRPLSTNYQSLNAYSKNVTDVFSATCNQASLANLKAGGFAASGERRFMLEDLKALTFVLAVPTASGTIGLQGDYFGGAGLKESELGFLYARKITKVVDVGIQFNYHAVTIAGYGAASAVNFEGGANVHLTETLHVGFHIYNPTSSKLGKIESEKLAAVYKVGLGYEISKQLFLGFEVVKQQQQQPGVNVGLDYYLHEKVLLKAGLSTLSNNIYAAVGYRFSLAAIHFYTAYHQQLGFTPGIMLLFNFKEVEQD